MNWLQRREQEIANALQGQAARIMQGDGSPLRGMDAQEALAFVVSQLAYTEAQTFEKQRIPMQYEQLVPISYAAGEWADSIRYEIYDYAGRGKRTAAKGKDINLVEVAYADKSFNVVNGNVGYDYTMEELRRSAYLRKPVDSTKQSASFEAYRRHMNEVALFGESDSALTGLFNNALAPQASAITGLWETGPKTPAQILADINASIFSVWQASAFNDLPTDIVMSPSRFAYISTTMLDSANASGTTILEYIRKMNLVTTQTGRPLNISPGYGLDTAGVGSTHRMVTYVKDESKVIFHIPMPMRFLAPQLIGLSVQIPGEYKYSGVELRYPKSMKYTDGI